MALLIFGLAIWSAAHLFGVVAPAARAGLTGKLGEHRAKGMMAGVILSGLVLMVLGYRMTDYVALYTPPTWAVHLNNLLMLAAIYLINVVAWSVELVSYTRRMRALKRDQPELARRYGIAG